MTDLLFRDARRQLLQRFCAWLLPIKLIKFDLWGTLGWKWYGGYRILDPNALFRVESQWAEWWSK